MSSTRNNPPAVPFSEELQRSEARFRAMFENAAVGIGIMGLDRRILDANPAMCRMLGMSRAELLGQTPVIITYPEDFAQSTADFQDLISGKQDTYWSERRYVRKNGEVFWAHVTMNIVRDAQGAPLYLVGMVIDIDEQKRLLAELRESEERFRAVFDSASVGVALMGLDRQIQAVNKAAQQLTGYSEEELKIIPTSQLALEEDRYLDRDLFLELVAGQRSQYTIEKRYVQKSGRIFWGRVNFSSVRDAHGKPQYLVGLIEDITEEKLAAERLAAQEAEYRQTLEERITARTAELNQATQLLQEKAAQEAVALERTRLARELHDAVTQTLFSASLIAEVLPEMWAMDADEARKSTEELRQLTRGALAEMRTLLLELRPAVLTQARFSDLLRQLCEALIGRARLPIQINIRGERDLPPDVQVALYRIAQESLNNVAKYARATQVTIALDLTPTSVRLEIADNGIGYDPRLLKPTSLGMRIMRERAETIGAQIQFDSKPGAGTTVTVAWEAPSQ